MVRNTTEEINFHRLLLSCEHKLKQQPIDIWTPSEKRKFATYVKYLTSLDTKLQSSNTKPYANRIEQLTKAVAEHTMHVDVEKGIAEARLVKKKHLNKLKQFEKSDPEWLLELKRQEEQEELQELEKKKKSLQPEEEEGEEAEKKDVVTEVVDKRVDKEPSKNELRQRNTNNRETSNETDTSNIEHVLQHHRQIHDELTTDLSKMAKQLKLNSQAFGDTLSKDDSILKEASQAVENNLERMRTERQRLDVHYSKSWSTSFITFGVVIFVCIMFILVFFTIRFLPKAS
ncbi:MAG: vesicle transport protein [Benjaminiella poitrasii]|nr:MAG: vesicle transport protein [Benjaminiella poitrasii]